MNTAATELVIEANPSPKLSASGYPNTASGTWTARVCLSSGVTVYLFHCRREYSVTGYQTHAAIASDRCPPGHYITTHLDKHLLPCYDAREAETQEYRRAVELLETLSRLLPDPPTQEIAAE